MQLILNIKKFEHFPSNLELKYQTDFSSGIDLFAAIQEKIIIKKNQRILIPAGISVELNEKNYEIQIRSRSGLALNHGVVVLNSPGTVDNDYRGEIKVILMNFGDSDFILEPGMRIAQMVICQYYHVKIEYKNELDETNRGSGGFGSTGE